MPCRRRAAADYGQFILLLPFLRFCCLWLASRAVYAMMFIA